MQRLERGVSNLFDRVDRLIDPRIDPLLARGNKLIDYCLTPHFHTRKFLQAVLPRAFPYEFTDFPGSDSFGRVMENSKNDRGTIIGITHFDKGEVPSIIGMILNQVDDEYLASDRKRDESGKIVLAPVASYVGRDGFNWECVHSFRAGPSVTRDELMTTLDGYHAQFGRGKQSRLRQADKWAFDMICRHRLVPDAYL